jgi:hypothetical protein
VPQFIDPVAGLQCNLVPQAAFGRSHLHEAPEFFVSKWTMRVPGTKV